MAPTGIGQGAADYQVEASSLLSIAKFVDWPENSFPDPNAPFTICVIGQDPFGEALDTIPPVGNREVEVDRYPALRNVSEARYCQIAFVSSSEKSRLRKIIGLFQGKSVLLVSDSEGFASAGGVVELGWEEGHVRFTINVDAADRADLKVSSKLLSLAQIVHDDPNKGKS